MNALPGKGDLCYMSQQDIHPTPREFDYWKLDYRELSLSPEWPEMSEEERAEALLARIEKDISEPDRPPQIRALFTDSREQNLKRVREMMRWFEEEDSATPEIQDNQDFSE